MKKLIIGILCTVFLLCTSAFAGTPGGVRGKVIDAKTREGVEFVNIKVTQKGATSLLQGSLSDIQGAFQIGGLKPGMYEVTFSCIGYKDAVREVQLSAASQVIDLKQISLSINEKVLQEVEVTGQRSQMRFEIDKKIFNVGQDLSSSGESASEVLENIPTVEVDMEGEVSLRGNSSVTIWINGKESGLTADNRAQILQQLPAETIDRIEIITNPSARFSSEGTAGIINIILRADRKAGYFGSIQAGGNTEGRANAGVNFNYSSPKLDVNAGAGYRHNENSGGGLSDRNYLTDNTYLNSRTHNEGNGNNFFGRAGMAYYFSKTDEVTLNGFANFGDRKNHTDINYDASAYKSLRTSDSDNQMKGGNVNLGYKHNFNNPDHYLDFTASYSIWNSDNSSLYHQTYENNPARTVYQNQNNQSDRENWAFQLDYLLQPSKNSKVEAGYKGTISRQDNPVQTLSGSSPEDAQPDYPLYNRFIYDEDLHALYATYSGKLKDFGFQLGLRGEYTLTNSRSDGTEDGTEVPGIPFRREYFSLFPSVFLSYSLPRENEIQINYSRRISRPRGSEINSFRNITDSTNISSGNPFLDPEFANVCELNYIKSWTEHTLSASLYYRTTEDVIEDVSYVMDDIMYSTSVNVTKDQSVGLDLTGKNRLTRWLELTSSFEMYYYKLSGFEYLGTMYDRQEQFSWEARLSANLSLPWGIALQITGDYDSPEAVSQGTRESRYFMNAGLKKSFFDKALNINLTARDILDSRTRKTTTSGRNFTQYSERWQSGPQVGITVTYNFGNMKAKQNKKLKGDDGGGDDFDSGDGDE